LHIKKRNKFSNYIMATNRLFYGDNLDVLRKYIRDETVDLCYIDPPFNSNRNYNQIYLNQGKEDKAQAQAFIDTWTWDKRAEDGILQIKNNQNGVFTRQSINLITGLEKVLGHGDLLAYLVSMTLRIAEIFRVLKPSGSFYLHCDATASHYLKLLTDSIFCANGGDFKREIIWSTTDTSGFKSRAKNWIRSHDIILFYVKSTKYYFKKLYWEHNPDYLKRFKKIDENGQKYRDDRPGGRKQFLNDTLGKTIGDVWDDIDSFQQASTNPEYLGYPTQKRIALLERIIEASSKENDLILDAYCGCGTTIAAAQQLKRNWIGIDITYQSISLILKRLEDLFKEKGIKNIELNGVPQDIESAMALAIKKDDRTRKEFEKWAILTYSNNRAIINEKKGSDKGIDGISFVLDSDNESKEIIFSVKSGNVTVANIRDLRGVIEREDAAIGILITLENPTKPMIQECKTAGIYNNKLTNQSFERLQIITINDIFDGKRLNMPMSLQVLKKAELKLNNTQSKLFDL